MNALLDFDWTKLRKNAELNNFRDLGFNFRLDHGRPLVLEFAPHAFETIARVCRLKDAIAVVSTDNLLQYRVGDRFVDPTLVGTRIRDSRVRLAFDIRMTTSAAEKWSQQGPNSHKLFRLPLSDNNNSALTQGAVRGLRIARG